MKIMKFPAESDCKANDLTRCKVDTGYVFIVKQSNVIIYLSKTTNKTFY